MPIIRSSITAVAASAATAVIGLLMMGMRMPETCWAVFKRQVINLRHCCIWLVDSFECTSYFVRYSATATVEILHIIPLVWIYHTMHLSWFPWNSHHLCFFALILQDGDYRVEISEPYELQIAHRLFLKNHLTTLIEWIQKKRYFSYFGFNGVWPHEHIRRCSE